MRRLFGKQKKSIQPQENETPSVPIIKPSATPRISVPASPLKIEPLNMSSSVATLPRSGTIMSSKSLMSASSTVVDPDLFRYGENIAQSTEDCSDLGEISAEKTQSLSPELPQFIKESKVIYSGFGGWILVKKVRKQGTLVVVKTFKPGISQHHQQYCDMCRNEYDVMVKVRNRNTVPVYNLCKDEESDQCYWSLIMPYYKNGDVFSFLAKDQDKIIPKKITEAIFKQMVQGVKFLHSKNVAHCDIKLDNFLIDDQFNIRITDFGMSVDLDKFSAYDEASKIKYCENIDISTLGTKTYRPPELFLHDKKLNTLENFVHGNVEDKDVIAVCLRFYESILEPKKLDVWSLAVCYIIMSTRLMKPWDFADRQNDKRFAEFFTTYQQSDFLSKNLPLDNTQEVNSMLDNAVTNHRDSLGFITKLSFDSKCVVLKMLSVNEELRVGIDDVFKSSWIKNIEFCSSEDFEDVFERVVSR